MKFEEWHNNYIDKMINKNHDIAGSIYDNHKNNPNIMFILWDTYVDDCKLLDVRQETLKPHKVSVEDTE